MQHVVATFKKNPKTAYFIVCRLIQIQTHFSLYIWLTDSLHKVWRKQLTHLLICGTINSQNSCRTCFVRLGCCYLRADPEGHGALTRCLCYLSPMLHQLRLQAIYQRPSGSRGSRLPLGLVEIRRCGPPLQTTPTGASPTPRRSAWLANPICASIQAVGSNLRL